MSRALRIAVADDEPDVRDDFRWVLPRLDHQVVAVAQTGRELVEQCRATRPDLVITDIKMPDLDGIEAAVAIGRDEPVPINPTGARPRFYRKIEKNSQKMPMHLLDKWRS